MSAGNNDNDNNNTNSNSNSNNNSGKKLQKKTSKFVKIFVCKYASEFTRIKYPTSTSWGLICGHLGHDFWASVSFHSQMHQILGLSS
jgi:hypothetical protein